MHNCEICGKELKEKDMQWLQTSGCPRMVHQKCILQENVKIIEKQRPWYSKLFDISNKQELLLLVVGAVIILLIMFFVKFI